MGLFSFTQEIVDGPWLQSNTIIHTNGKIVVG